MDPRRDKYSTISLRLTKGTQSAAEEVSEVCIGRFLWHFWQELHLCKIHHTAPTTIAAHK